jgi:DedD protein
MKLIMDEKLKHRLIGLAVIISIAAIFAPAVLRKSSQNFETISVRIAVPPKPAAPEVVVSHKNDLFKTIKIAKVTLAQDSIENPLPQPVNADHLSSSSHESETLSKAEPEPEIESVKITATPAKKPTLAASISPLPPKVKPKLLVKAIKAPKTTQVHRAPVVKKDTYAVQLATFSKLANAQSLVNKLHGKGYKANLIKIASRQGTIYKVSVGNSPNKDQLIHLRKQLAHAVQLNGFIVNTGVS